MYVCMQNLLPRLEEKRFVRLTCLQQQTKNTTLHYRLPVTPLRVLRNVTSIVLCGCHAIYFRYNVSPLWRYEV